MSLKLLLTIFGSIVLIFPVISQVKKMDSSNLGNWKHLSSINASSDAKYIMYSLESDNEERPMVIFQSIDNTWRKEVVGGIFRFENGISSDSKRGFCLTERDTLEILKLGTTIVDKLDSVKSFRIADNKKQSWVIYATNRIDGRLGIKNIKTNRSFFFIHVTEYIVGKNSRSLIIKIDNSTKSVNDQSIVWFNLLNGEYHVISDGSPVSNVLLDTDEKQLVYTSPTAIKGEKYNLVYYYKLSLRSPILLFDKQLSSSDSSLYIDNLVSFSLDGNKVFVSLKKKTDERKASSGVPIDIWSYFDQKLQSVQLHSKIDVNTFKGVINIRNNKLIRIEQKDEACYKNCEKYCLVVHKNSKIDESESIFNKFYNHSVYVVSTENGTRTLISDSSKFYHFISPAERFIIYYNFYEKDFYSYEIATGIRRNITKGISTNWMQYDNEQPDAVYGNSGISGWLRNDSSIFIPDQNDIWQVDPTGRKNAINITNGYGKINNLVFRFAEHSPGSVIKNSQKLILSAFDYKSKENGFYESNIGLSSKAPKKLTMGPYIYYYPDNDLGLMPMRIGQTNSFIVQRESAEESPNYFITNDFKKYVQLTYIYPERQYNWLKTELIHWKIPNGKIYDGVLYKPKDFDSLIKYPIIFNYYNKKSYLLNAFLKPGFSTGNINIPWFVDNGYLVFTPDIHFEIGKTGESAVNCLVAAADELGSKKWINKDKIGLQGHSFGSYLTNYVITQTNKFAAAISACGLSDLISEYNAVNSESGVSNQQWVETSGIGTGCTLWDRPDIFIQNSPIFYANQVVTPLLMMSNKADAAAEFYQSVEFFTALRRLGKKVWLLQYDEGGHGVYGRSAVDYTIRMQQFFDFYLKDSLPPLWLSRGVDASVKGYETGLFLDTSRSIP